jgi:hypothetical protein
MFAIESRRDTQITPLSMGAPFSVQEPFTGSHLGLVLRPSYSGTCLSVRVVVL